MRSVRSRENIDSTRESRLLLYLSLLSSPQLGVSHHFENCLQHSKYGEYLIFSLDVTPRITLHCIVTATALPNIVVI